MSPTHGTRPRSERSGRGGRSRVLLIGAALAGLVLVLLGTLAVVRGAQETSAPPQSPAAAPTAPAGPILAPSAATAVSVPAIGARGPLTGLGLTANREMATPPLAHPELGSWYTGGPTPGTQGPAVILGHVNGDGHPGIFGKLAQLRPGDTVEVTRADRTVAVFTVDRLAQITKDAFPAAAVFNDTAAAELRLITCGGDLDASKHSYRDNVIVYAHLTGSHPA